MRYRRVRIKGGTCFFTVVTHHRQKIFSHSENVQLLREAFQYVMKNHTLTIDAFVLLPDHLHCIWTLPETDDNYSMRWRLLKGYFSRHCDERFKHVDRGDGNEPAVWQQRFGEHTIRDEADFTKHVEYIHYNPVKHGHALTPVDWPYSSFHRYVKRGLYEARWAAGVHLAFEDGIGGE